MKKIILIILFILPVFTQAQMPWFLNNYTVLYGTSINLDQGRSHQFEFLYEKGHRTCVGYSYFGIGLNTTYNSVYQEIGIKVQINPFRRTHFWLFYKIYCFPYAYMQGNYTNTTLESSNFSLNIRPGLGINGIINPRNSIINYRVNIQSGYTLEEQFNNFESNFTLDIRIGIGLNQAYFSHKRKRRLKD